MGFDAQRRLKRRREWGKDGGVFKDDVEVNENAQPTAPLEPNQPPDESADSPLEPEAGSVPPTP